MADDVQVTQDATHNCKRSLKIQMKLVNLGRTLRQAWLVRDPLAIVRPIAPLATITCGLWCFAMIWADRQVLPKALRMNRLWLLLSVIAGVAMTGFGIRAIFD